jgi:peptidoglycan/xylan/chitin deacetylase (PgdA/CDA1 family)
MKRLGWVIILLVLSACTASEPVFIWDNLHPAEEQYVNNTFSVMEKATNEAETEEIIQIAYVPEPAEEIIEEIINEDTDQNAPIQIDEPELKKIALTFDDGPSEQTAFILDILERYGARATFCVIGRQIERNRDIVRRAVDLGCEIIGHSWNHQNLTYLSSRDIQNQLINTHTAIEDVVGEMPYIYRPPYGGFDRKVIEASKEAGFALLGWSVDPRDWENRNEDAIYENIMRFVKEGSVIICHDAYPSTVRAMERVIPRLMEEGYQLVTVSELIRHLEGEIVPGTVYYGNR